MSLLRVGEWKYPARGPHDWKFPRCRCELTAPARTRLQYSAPRMKPDAFSITALRASRTLASIAGLAALAMLACWAYDFALARILAVSLPAPLALLTVALLGASVLLAGFRKVAFHVSAQVLAALAAGVALSSVIQTWAGIDLQADLLLFGAAGIAARMGAGTASGDQVATLFGSFALGWDGYLAIVAQILLVAVVTALASRRTVNRTLETVD